MNRTDRATPCTWNFEASCFWVRATLAFALSFCLTTQGWAVQEPSPAPPETKAPAPEAKAPEGGQILLLDGTPVKIRMNRTMSSADASVGQPVDFTVTQDVAVNGTTVIPKGSAAMGKVTEAQPKRRMGRAGKLEIVLTYVRLADTETVPVRAVKDVKGKNAAVGMTVGIVAAGVLFFPAAPLFLLMKGKDITVPEGAEVVAYVDGDKKLEAAKFGMKPEVAAAAPAPAAPTTPVVPLTTEYPANVPPETSGLLEIQSTPAAASVYVDGTFMSNTPATLHLSPGPHSVRVTLDGYKEWTQDLSVQTGASSHLTADLEKLN
jgi:hypothetical protein